MRKHFKPEEKPILLIILITMLVIAVIVQVDRMLYRPGQTQTKAYLQTSTGVRVEAEEMNLVSVTKDQTNSFIDFNSSSPIQIASQTVQCPPAGSTAGGVATMDVDLNEHANYHIWIQMKAKGSANALWFRIDDRYCVQVGGSNAVAPNKWVWVDFINGDTTQKIPSQLLGTGHHIIQIIGDVKETGVAVDRFLMLMDASCTPVDNGDTCLGIVPTPTPTPSPTPAQASTFTTSTTTSTKPVITTDALPDGSVGVSYQASVVATSTTPSETLGMTAQRLPDGITLQSCQLDSGFGGATLTCPLVGTPTKSGVTNPSFSVVDGSGNKTQKTIKIRVK